ncbi:MAG: hypothetical protein HQM08_05920 [Candidatus Riflebacteria bacterium]|nr:hypothetical protein [Candidatus Riflebacteria bacterium]
MKLHYFFLSLIVGMFCTCSIFAEGTKPGRTEFNALAKVFLGTDEKENAKALEAVQKVSTKLKHQIHEVVFPKEAQLSKEVQDEIKDNNIASTSLPVIVVDDKVLKPGDDLEKLVNEIIKVKRVTITAHLEKDIDEKNNLILMGYVCCFVGDELIEKGRVKFYVIEDVVQKDSSTLPTFKAVLSDNRDYLVESQSCHAPETLYWAIPKGVDGKNLKGLISVWDGKGQMLGTACSSEDCTEKSKDCK